MLDLLRLIKGVSVTAAVGLLLVLPLPLIFKGRHIEVTVVVETAVLDHVDGRRYVVELSGLVYVLLLIVNMVQTWGAVFSCQGLDI